MHEFSDICGEEVDLFGPVPMNSDDINLELSKYAMTFIDMFTFNMDTQTNTSAPEQVEQFEQSATPEMVSDARPEVFQEQVELDKEAPAISKDWRLLKNRGWVRTLRRRSDLKEFYEYTNPDVLCHDSITSMKRAMFIDKSRGVTNIKRKHFSILEPADLEVRI